MAAPVWPPDPKKAFELTAEEYGVSPEELGADEEEDEEAERALLAAFLFRSPERQLVAGERNGLSLAELRRSLHAFLRAVSGLDFQLAAADPASTDGTHVFLPRAVPAPPEPTDTLLFRVMGLVQLGLVRFGLLDSPGVVLEIYRDWVLRSCYHLLAARYVAGRWSRAYPGLARDFQAVDLLDKAGIMRVNLTVVPREGMPGAFRPLYRGMTASLNWEEPGPEGEPARRAVAAVEQAIERYRGDPLGPDRAAPLVLLGQAQRLRQHFRRLRLGPPPLPYFVGILRPEWVLAAREHDPEWELEWTRGNKPLRQLLAARARAEAEGGPALPPPEPPPEPRSLRRALKRRLKKLLQGPGDPDELRRAPAYGLLRDEYQAQREREERERARRQWSPDTPLSELLDEPSPLPTEDDGFEYDEWDDENGVYRLSAVRVFEEPAPPGPPDAYERIVEANRRAIAQVRRSFEALRVEERWLHGQPDGSEIDIDRAILALCDVAAGQDPDPRIYQRFQRERQQVAILTLVDLSGSTQGRVIYLEQEAIVLFAEGLRTLGFPHAFYGFHNQGPENCRMERIKGFDEPYGPAVYRRLGHLQPGGATRLGAFIRHAAALLERRHESRRVLLVISDGKPEDRGRYQGSYGVRDSAMAVFEARRAGIHLHCVSLDPGEEAADYLERIFGRSGYLLLPRVELLPRRLPEVFRELVR